MPDMIAFQQYTQKFADVSPIHGLSYIARRHHWAEACLWLFVMVVCVGFCIKDTTILILAYSSGATSVSVKMKSEPRLRLKDIGFCFDVSRPILDSSLYQIFDETKFNESLSFLNALISNDSSAEWDFTPWATNTT